MKKKRRKRKNKKDKKLNIKKFLKQKSKLIIVIIILLIGLLSLFYLIDKTRVERDDMAPIFARKTAEYGESAEYIGIGYKIIFYNQIGGRYDRKIGFWNMKYVDKPTKLNMLDLSIEYTDNPVDTYKKYLGEYIEITGIPYVVDKKNNVIRFQYNDPDNKYTFATDFYLMFSVLEDYKDKEVTLVGTVDNFRDKDKENPNALIIKNAFIKE